MRVVTRRTGLSADLLRAWEKRYEVVKPSRSRTGRRLYSDADIERLRLLYRATLAGRTIGLISKLSTKELAVLVRRDGEAERSSDGALKALPAVVPDYLPGCFRAIEQLDVVGLEAILRRAVVMLSAETLVDALVAPLLDRVGARWRDGSLRPVHGHFASVMMRRVLDRVIETATSPLATPNIVVATPAGQVHEFGAMLAAATAATEGWLVTYLGANLPAEDIAEAATRTRARAVALSIVYPAGDSAVGYELRRLRTLLARDLTLVVGGASSPAYRAVLDEMGADLLDDLTDFRSKLRTMHEDGAAAAR
jgi:methylmalonyl-CoA mutase cobalamin-binding subunit